MRCGSCGQEIQMGDVPVAKSDLEQEMPKEVFARLGGEMSDLICSTCRTEAYTEPTKAIPQHNVKRQDIVL